MRLTPPHPCRAHCARSFSSWESWFVTLLSLSALLLTTKWNYFMISQYWPLLWRKTSDNFFIFLYPLLHSFSSEKNLDPLETYNNLLQMLSIITNNITVQCHESSPAVKPEKHLLLLSQYWINFTPNNELNVWGINL